MKAKMVIMMCVSLLLFGCSKGDLKTIEVVDNHCTTETAKSRSEFILSCIGNANPKSDEEPEDWIKMCQDMAEDTLCEKATFVVTKECLTNLGCMWTERTRYLKPQ